MIIIIKWTLCLFHVKKKKFKLFSRVWKFRACVTHSHSGKETEIIIVGFFFATNWERVRKREWERDCVREREQKIESFFFRVCEFRWKIQKRKNENFLLPYRCLVLWYNFIVNGTIFVPPSHFHCATKKKIRVVFFFKKRKIEITRGFF